MFLEMVRGNYRNALGDVFMNPACSLTITRVLLHVLSLSLLLCGMVALPAQGAEKPKIRTVTAFLLLDRAQYRQQIMDALRMLRNAQSRFELAGYEVETIRIAT